MGLAITYALPRAVLLGRKHCRGYVASVNHGRRLVRGAAAPILAGQSRIIHSLNYEINDVASRDIAPGPH